MPQTVAEYLRRIEPREVDSRGRLRDVPESRLRAFAAAREVLRAGGGSADYRRAVAMTVAAAARHGAEGKAVWRLVRRFREQNHNWGEQLTLPLPENSREHVRRRGPWAAHLFPLRCTSSCRS
jgi:hypothetical protein